MYFILFSSKDSQKVFNSFWIFFSITKRRKQYDHLYAFSIFEFQGNICEKNNPCENGGICGYTRGGYICKCQKGWEGDDCSGKNSVYHVFYNNEGLLKNLYKLVQYVFLFKDERDSFKVHMTDTIKIAVILHVQPF